MSGRGRIWLRWSWRDLRARWVQVAAIAFIIALGSGIYSGLSSTAEWRRTSYDASFARLNMYDLRAVLSTGSFVDAEELVAAATSIPSARSIRAAEVRLLVSTQVDASSGGSTTLVPGRLVGVDVTDGGPHVAAISAERGRGLRADDAGERHAVIDLHFAERHSLPVPTRIEVSGGPLEVIGHGLAPEYFLITGEQGNLLAESNYAVVFAPIQDVQAITDRPGLANDLVITVRPGADRATVRRELQETLRARFPDVGIDVEGPRADDAYRLLYDDIEGDQRFYNIFAVLILAGAAFAAFNLTGRIVEAQRREIGVGMAIGVPPAELAVRPMLVAAQVAALGVVFGVGVGVGVAMAMGGVLQDLFPLPIWRFPFQPDVFARGALLGLALPFLAAAIPVWRAVRVAPIDAIRTAYLSSGRRVPALARVPLPGRTTAQLPFRSLLRAPRRTVMTVLGVAVAIVVLMGVVGMVDSFRRTIDVAHDEIERTAPRRTTVDLESFVLTDDATVQAIRDSPAVAVAEPHLRVGGSVSRGGETIDLLIEVLPLGDGIWSPATTESAPRSGKAGIVLTERALADLDVDVGDTVALRHPRRTGLTAYEFVTSPVRVVGVSPLPTRFVAFMDSRDAEIMNLSGVTNSVVVTPAPDVALRDLERSLFGMPGVGSVQPVREYTDTIRKEIDRFLGILTVVEAAVLLLALLIAFNSASINADERARDHATMFAFGLPTRTVLRMNVGESAVVGMLGTTLGLGVGWLLLDWLVQRLLPETFPDLAITTSVATRTLVVALVLGVAVVAFAPVLTYRKLRRMDIPSTLRVME